MLSNPKLRAKYDAEGAAGLDTNSFVDSSVFFAVLFGNEKFNDYIGVLMISVAARSSPPPFCRFPFPSPFPPASGTRGP